MLILLPEGVGVRNFIYTGFLQEKKARLWTPLNYLSSQYDLVPLPDYHGGGMVDLYKNALIRSNLKLSYSKYGNKAYLDYIRKSTRSGLRHRIKEGLIDLFSFSSQVTGIEHLWHRYLSAIRKTDYYRDCLEVLEREAPSVVFCTNQRMSSAAAPILAARDLGIPTATFIFSWDNMPKGNLSVPAEHLFVWSDYMKDEAKRYYPWVDPDKVHITGTPQFIPYTDETILWEREEFCRRYGLDSQAKLICFSGDDVTTSPYDPMYLEDTAKAVARLNARGEERYQILFRRCPVDVSNRYDRVLDRYRELIVPVDPLWEKPEGVSEWNGMMPTEADMILLANTVYHCETALNVGSTIAHDFACMGKTSCYIKYNVPDHREWDIEKIYRYVHFESMDGLDPVYWIEDPRQMAETLSNAMDDTEQKLGDARSWLHRIVKHPLNDANERIWKNIETIAQGKQNACRVSDA